MAVFSAEFALYFIIKSAIFALFIDLSRAE